MTLLMTDRNLFLKRYYIVNLNDHNFILFVRRKLWAMFECCRELKKILKMKMDFAKYIKS